jgi:hypothetical protein
MAGVPQGARYLFPDAGKIRGAVYGIGRDDLWQVVFVVYMIKKKRNFRYSLLSLLKPFILNIALCANWYLSC